MHHGVKCAAVVLSLSLSLCAQAQQRQIPPLEAHASGVFLNRSGDVLTALHAVHACQTIYALKDTRIVEAKILASDTLLDLAVLGTSLKPYLSATFLQTENNMSGSIAVFSEAYSVLQRLKDRATLLSNAMTVPGTQLQLLSGVKPGASGSAVLDRTGLIMGVVTERIGLRPESMGASTVGKMSSKATLSSYTTSATLVHAVGGEQIKQFLRRNAIAFAESDVPQLGAGQAPAARATTLAVGVICGE